MKNEVCVQGCRLEGSLRHRQGQSKLEKTPLLFLFVQTVV